MSSRQRRLFEKNKDILLVFNEDSNSSTEEETESLTTYSNPYNLLEQEPEHSDNLEVPLNFTAVFRTLFLGGK